MRRSKVAEEVSNGERYLTVRQVAEIVCKHPSTVSRWVTDGLLQCIRLPSGIPAIAESEVRKLIGNSALAHKVK